MIRLSAVASFALLWVLGTGSAGAVLIASGDGTGNTSAPADDPGWDHVARRGGLTAVYLGNNWMLTANHVGANGVELLGVTYPALPDSRVQLDTGGTGADLIVYKIQGDVPLPPLPLAASTPKPNQNVVMIGNGRSRGAETSWMGIDGFEWITPNTMRWGTNRVAQTGLDLPLGATLTRSFTTTFSAGLPTAHEAQGANGDSGGALFVKKAGSWQLSGILYAISGFTDQPASTALYGNLTYASDLAFYRSAILAVVDVPPCDDGWDDDGDGLVDYPADPGCDSALDTSERDALLPCDDGVDNDADGFVDVNEDLGCRSATFGTESPQCEDGIDNDSDGGTDWNGSPPDTNCLTPWRRESPSRCGLGFELVLLLPVLRVLRRRRR